MFTDTNTPAVEMKMQPTEFANLRAAVADIGQRDFHLGRVLNLLVLHLGHAHGLDAGVEDARLAAEARQTARDAEDARLKAEAEALVKTRAAEDAQPRTALEKEQLLVTRAAQDLQIKADAEALAKAREEEDARLKASAEAADAPLAVVAPEAPVVPVEGASYAN